MGRMLSFFESFPFFLVGRRPWAFVGPVAYHVFAFFRVSLIVVPDSSPRGFGRVNGFGQRVFRQFSPLK